MKALVVVALCCAMASASGAQRQANLGVSASVPSVGCPAGVTAPSCAPFAEVATAAGSYAVAVPAGALGGESTIQRIEGKVSIVTVTY